MLRMSDQSQVLRNADLDVRHFAESLKQPEHLAHPQISELSRLNLSHEQDLYQDINKIKHRFKTNSLTKPENRKFILIGEILHYITNHDTDPCVQ